MIEFRKIITRDMLRRETDKLFVFGDNMLRVGLGGQAAAMRGEPNAVGIPTKWGPSMERQAFFQDKDYASWEVASKQDWRRLQEHVENGGTIVWPADDIGTGLAQLPERAPNIFAMIQVQKQMLNSKAH